MTNKEDRRIQRTKNAIEKAFLALLKEKGFSNMTIRELSDKAGVNRKTFYNHYNNLYDVLEEIEDKSVQHFAEILHTHTIEEYVQDSALFFLTIMTELERDKEFYTLINSNMRNTFIEKLEKQEKTILVQTLGEFGAEEQAYLEYMMQFVLAGTSAILNKWLFSYDRIPAEDIASFLGSFIDAKEMQRFIQNR